jgi:hypothetical protein
MSTWNGMNEVLGTTDKVLIIACHHEWFVVFHFQFFRGSYRLFLREPQPDFENNRKLYRYCERPIDGTSFYNYFIVIASLL